MTDPIRRSGVTRRRFVQFLLGTSAAALGAGRHAGSDVVEARDTGAVAHGPSLLPSVDGANGLRFEPLAMFAGEFGSGQTANPRGVAFSPVRRTLIVSITPQSLPGYPPPTAAISSMLTSVSLAGNRAPFGPGDGIGLPQHESKPVIVPLAGPSVEAGFKPGWVLVPAAIDYAPGRVLLLDETGATLSTFLDLTNTEPLGLWGGMALDVRGNLFGGGQFAGRLVVLGRSGTIYVVRPSGTDGVIQTTVTPKTVPLHPEGPAIVPAGAGWGSLEGQVVFGVEGDGMTPFCDPHSGQVWAVDAAGAVTVLASIGLFPESLSFVPPAGGTYLQCQCDFERPSSNRLWAISAGQFLSYPGHLIVAGEITGELWAIPPGGTPAVIGRVPGRWGSQGQFIQVTELEAGVFAVLPPDIPPTWSAGDVSPGGATFTTARVPAVWGAGTHVHLVAMADGKSGFGAGQYSYARYDLSKGVFDPTHWGELSVAGEDAPTGAPALAAFDSPLFPLDNALDANLFVFATRADGTLMVKTSALDCGPGTVGWTAWRRVPGDGLTTNLTPSAAAVNGRLILCAVNAADRTLYINELRPGQSPSWGGWSAVPGSRDITSDSPAIFAFQDELWIAVRGSSGIRIITRSVDGAWFPWAAPPVSPPISGSLAAATAPDGQAFLVVSEAAGGSAMSVALSQTGTWGVWKPLPGASFGTGTAVAVAGTALSYSVVVAYVDTSAGNTLRWLTGRVVPPPPG